MLQYATFLPVMRSHGSETPREPWQFGNPGEPFYESILGSIRLRYSLLPYTYSLAARVTHDGYTITRALAFDFPRDHQVLDIKDEFMFGPSFLVAPMTKKGTSRSVYLPQGSGWTDYHTGMHHAGGQYVTADAPISRIPLFVRDGSIVPIGADVEYADQDPDARTLLVYPGNDASFTLYEDEGDNYNCEQGASSSIPITWDDSKRTLTIGTRIGLFPGMTASRTFNVRLANGKTKTVKYMGKAKKVKF
jgi:alpha-D-xyloside xylohydrolase